MRWLPSRLTGEADLTQEGTDSGGGGKGRSVRFWFFFMPPEFLGGSGTVQSPSVYPSEGFGDGTSPSTLDKTYRWIWVKRTKLLGYPGFHSLEDYPSYWSLRVQACVESK